MDRRLFEHRRHNSLELTATLHKPGVTLDNDPQAWEMDSLRPVVRLDSEQINAKSADAFAQTF